MKKAIIYARFSPRKDAATSESNEFQIEALEKWCADNDYAVEGIFQDRALSGSKHDRPGLYNALYALKKDMALVVYSLDRLAREMFLAEWIRQEVITKGASIVSVDGANVDESEDANQILIRQVTQAIAEFQRRQIGAKTKAAMIRHQASGRRMTAKDCAPFGWMTDPRNKKRIVKCDREQVILRIIRALQLKGMNVNAISNQLNKDLIPCRKARRWYPMAVRRIVMRAMSFQGE